MKVDMNLVVEIKDNNSRRVVAMMQKMGSRDVAVMTHRDGYTIIRSIDPVTPTKRLHHVSVSHLTELTSAKTAEVFARAIYPSVKQWEPIRDHPSVIMDMWEVE